jgi:hypothetical protein
MKSDEMPEVLRWLVPTVGSVWLWEPEKPHARTVLTVTKVEWKGEAVWVTAREASGVEYPNELDRWVEATVLVRPAEGDE